MSTPPGTSHASSRALARPGRRDPSCSCSSHRPAGALLLRGLLSRRFSSRLNAPRPPSPPRAPSPGALHAWPLHAEPPVDPRGACFPGQGLCLLGLPPGPPVACVPRLWGSARAHPPRQRAAAARTGGGGPASGLWTSAPHLQAPEEGPGLTPAPQAGPQTQAAAGSLHGLLPTRPPCPASSLHLGSPQTALTSVPPTLNNSGLEAPTPHSRKPTQNFDSPHTDRQEPPGAWKPH